MSRSADIGRKLDSARTLASVVGTMKTLAAVRIGQYRRAVHALEASDRTLELALQTMLRAHPELLEGGDAPQDGRVAAVVFGSDRGLCGPFNERVAQHASGLLAARTADGAPARVLAVGRRMRTRLAARGWPAERRVEPPGSLEAVDVAASRVLETVDRWRAQGSAERLFLVHARPTSGLRFEPYALQLLPLDRAWLRSLRDRAWPSRRLPVPFHDGRELVRGVVRQLVAHALVRAFAASQASENAARLAAMEAAERTIEDRIDRLRTTYQAARQNAITEELLDIQAAYAASETPSRR